MAKVFANVCFCDVFVLFWMQCSICKRCEPFCILGFVCKVLKKEVKFTKCVSSWKNGNITRKKERKKEERKKERKKKERRKERNVFGGENVLNSFK